MLFICCNVTLTRAGLHWCGSALTFPNYSPGHVCKCRITSYYEVKKLFMSSFVSVWLLCRAGVCYMLNVWKNYLHKGNHREPLMANLCWLFKRCRCSCNQSQFSEGLLCGIQYIDSVHTVTNESAVPKDGICSDVLVPC